jgi:hypothetical protein
LTQDFLEYQEGQCVKLVWNWDLQAKRRMEEYIQGEKLAANYCNFTAVGVLSPARLIAEDIQIIELKRKRWRGWGDSIRRPAV